MKTLSHLYLTLCICLLIFTSSCTQNDKANPINDAHNMRGDFIPEPDLSELVIDLNTAMEEAYNKGDMKGVAAFYTSDALLLGPNKYKVEGAEEVHNYWARIKVPISWDLSVHAFSRDESAVYKTDAYKKLFNKPPDWKEAIGDKLDGKSVIYQLGHSTLKYRREGEVQTGDVDFIIVWKQEASGVYKIAVDSYAVNKK